MIKQVEQVIGSELKEFEKVFQSQLKGSNVLLDRVLKFIVNRKGKQMRPMFVMLCAKLCGGITERSYRAASLIEILHTATLVHDDVVDHSMVRRGFFSVNALWKNKIAVLVGDYLLAKGLLLSIDNGDIPILEITSTAVKEMSEGELLQMEKARKLDIKEDIYFEIIRAKTATLLAAACSAGAFSANENLEDKNYFRLFGEKIGIAFQIKDVLFDYGLDKIGKPTGQDIKEKKMTLPLIYTLQNCSADNRRLLMQTVKKNSNDHQKVQHLIQIVQETGGIDYATQKMLDYRDEALDMLEKFPASAEKEALKALVNYVIDRMY
jgi:octaprenyl-diphosphate synthase